MLNEDQKEAAEVAFKVSVIIHEALTEAHKKSYEADPSLFLSAMAQDMRSMSALNLSADEYRDKSNTYIVDAARCLMKALACRFMAEGKAAGFETPSAKGHH